MAIGHYFRSSQSFYQEELKDIERYDVSIFFFPASNFQIRKVYSFLRIYFECKTVGQLWNLIVGLEDVRCVLDVCNS
jgi:hypothetical protein